MQKTCMKTGEPANKHDGALPFITVIIPCRNEEKHIDKCLDSTVNTEYPKSKLEVLVMDGMSGDGTREKIKGFSGRWPFIRLMDNPKKTVPAALNIGIENAKGEIIIRLDAHSIYNKDYIPKCVKYLQEHDVDNVGGLWVILPGDNTYTAESIALAVSHFFGAGNAYYRIGSEKPRLVDTVPFGCYRKEVFNEIGVFDEDMIRNQDDELNMRLLKNGGKILLVPDIVSYYHARDTISKLGKMYFQYGYFKPLVALKTRGVFTFRQIMPPTLVASSITLGILSFAWKVFLWPFLLLLFLYVAANIFFSSSIAIRRGLKYFFVLPSVFFTIHFGYGMGYIKGIWDFIIRKKYRKNIITDIPLTR